MKQELTLEGRISQVITPSLAQLGYELVKLYIADENLHKILRVLIERADNKNINVDDCEKASKQISVIIDIEEPNMGNYTLEVSSPGIDRPLTRLKDFINYSGLEAKIEVLSSIEGQKKFRGRLNGVEGNDVIIDTNIICINEPDKKQISKIDFDNIKNAKLVLNDELLSFKKKDANSE